MTETTPVYIINEVQEEAITKAVTEAAGILLQADIPWGEITQMPRRGASGKVIADLSNEWQIVSRRVYGNLGVFAPFMESVQYTAALWRCTGVEEKHVGIAAEFMIDWKHRYGGRNGARHDERIVMTLHDTYLQWQFYSEINKTAPRTVYYRNEDE